MTNNLKVLFLLQMKDMHLLISYFIPFSRSRRTEKKLSIRNTLSGEIFVGRNYSSTFARRIVLPNKSVLNLNKNEPKSEKVI